MEFVEKEDTTVEISMGISIPSVNNSVVSYEQSQFTNVNNKGGKTVNSSKKAGKHWWQCRKTGFQKQSGQA